VDIAAAEAAPGVHLVWTHRNVPEQGVKGTRVHPRSTAPARPVLENEQVAFFGQPVAFVVAETFEQAKAAADLVRLTYDEDEPQVDFRARLGDAVVPHGEEDTEIGDFAAGYAAAPVKVDETWHTPIQNHCQMEPCATLAWWEGEKCIVHTSIQMVKPAQHGLAETLKIDRDAVHLLTRYIGGGFGGKGQSYDDLALVRSADR
jgi:xanthine dehydrogenase YagR molybdenum-binding subunit